jgi:uncharacterized membrane protein
MKCSLKFSAFAQIFASFCLTLAVAVPASAQDATQPLKITLTTITVPGAAVTEINGINSAGDMVGFYGQNLEEAISGFSYLGGEFTYFDYPGQSYTVPGAINDSNVIVGYATQVPSEGAPVYGFTYDGTSFTTLTDGSDYATYGFGINNAGVVVGRAGGLYGAAAFELTNGRYKTVHLPGSCTYKQAEAINNLDEIVAYTSCGVYAYGYTVRNGRQQSIDYPGAQETAALGINDNGFVVGWYNPVTLNDYAFIYAKGKYVSFTYPGATYTFASGINNSGEIVGSYTSDNITIHGFVSSPVTAEDFNFAGCCLVATVVGR